MAVVSHAVATAEASSGSPLATGSQEVGNPMVIRVLSAAIPGTGRALPAQPKSTSAKNAVNMDILLAYASPQESPRIATATKEATEFNKSMLMNFQPVSTVVKKKVGTFIK